jgi:hypothetical protein
VVEWQEWREREREQYIEGATVVSLIMCTESCAVGGKVVGGDYSALRVMAEEEEEEGEGEEEEEEEEEQQRHTRQTCVNNVE